MFTNILCATDASPDGDRALEYAAAVAADEHARLGVVHVVERIPGGRGGVQNSHPDEPERDAWLRRRASELSRGGLAVTIHTPQAPARAVADRVVEIARDQDADLIVIGTRGRSPMVGAVLGSVAQRLLHIAPCPVLAIPDRCADVPGDERVAAAATG